MPAYRFPSRSPLSASQSREAVPGLESAGAELREAPAAGLVRFVLGLDAHPRLLTAAELADLNDPVAELLFRRGVFPATLNALLRELSAFDGQPAGVPDQMVFIAGDGGQIEWKPGTEGLDRLFRLVISRRRTAAFDVLISSAIDADSTADFLQVIGWDEARGHFNYYERDRRSGQWGWAGNSWHALQAPSRGMGPFDSHVNGSMVMKELKAPWIHWHSMAASIPETAFAQNDAFLRSAFWTGRSSAHLLENQVVRPGIRTWTKRRWEKDAGGGVWPQPRAWMRHLLVSTTVNLTSSPQLAPARHQPAAAAGRLRLPLGFFLNADALLNIADLTPAFADDETGAALPDMDTEVYRGLLNRYDVHLRENEGPLRVERDTHFAFLVPEPAFEDNEAIREMVRPGRLSIRLAASLLMTDFSNPCFSARRAALMAHVPEQAAPLAQIEPLFVAAARAAAAAAAGSPEEEFLAWYDHPDREAAMAARLDEYLAGVRALLATADGADAVFRLAESRRRSFRRRKLAEFRLTTPATTIPEDAPPLVMTALAAVEEGRHAEPV